MSEDCEAIEDFESGDVDVGGDARLNVRCTSGDNSLSTRRARRAIEARWGVGKGIVRSLLS